MAPHCIIVLYYSLNCSQDKRSPSWKCGSCTTYQDAVEELVDAEPQHAGHHVRHVVQKLHIHDHGFVASDEGAKIPHEAHQKHDLINELEESKRDV